MLAIATRGRARRVRLAGSITCHLFCVVRLDLLLDLRRRALTPGHPGRPVVWPHDAAAPHYGIFDGDRLVGAASLTAQPMPDHPPTRRHSHPMWAR